MKLEQGFATVKETVTVPGFLEKDGKLESAQVEIKEGTRVFALVEQEKMEPFSITTSLRTDEYRVRVAGNAFSGDSLIKIAR